LIFLVTPESVENVLLTLRVDLNNAPTLMHVHKIAVVNITQTTIITSPQNLHNNALVDVNTAMDVSSTTQGIIKKVRTPNGLSILNRVMITLKPTFRAWSKRKSSNVRTANNR
jgi:hypothetical protein